jgi:hypothetical protein
MTRLRLPFALVLGMLFVGAPLPSIARADDPEPEVSDQADDGTTGPDPMHLRWDRMLGVELTGGVDTPFGVVGGALMVQPVRFLRIDLGGGVSRDGARLAGGVSVVLPQDHFALVLRVGAAGGPLSWDGDHTDLAPTTGQISPPLVHNHRYWGFAAFLDTSIGLEYRFDEGVLLRLYAGVETTLSDHADACAASSGECPSTTVHDHPARLFGGLSVGYMFDIYP